MGDRVYELLTLYEEKIHAPENNIAVVFMNVGRDRYGFKTWDKRGFARTCGFSF